MGLLERVKSLVKANIKDILRQAEDPEQALDQLIKRMEADLAEARAGVATAVRDERKLHSRHAQHLREVEVMVQRAEAAVRKGRDDLAREALRRRRQHEADAAALQAEWEAQREALDELQENLAHLQAKIEQARRERDTLLARRRLARARRDMAQATAVGGAAAANQALDRAGDAIDELEAEAQAYAELAKDDTATQRRAAQHAPSAEDAQIEAELQALKERIGGSDE